MTAADTGRIPGAEIRRIRNYWNEPRRDFAAHFGVSCTTVYAWERYGTTRRNQKFNRATFRWLALPAEVADFGNE